MRSDISDTDEWGERYKHGLSEFGEPVGALLQIGVDVEDIWNEFVSTVVRIYSENKN